jgi:hypothetical protein
MGLTDKQFLNLLKDLIKETLNEKEVLLETPKKKKTICEKTKDSGKTR